MNSTNSCWKEDRLGRKEDAEFLTTYLRNRFNLSHEISSHGSFVLNINAEWGFGKTYFLQNWSDELAAMNFPVIYFNAWDSDFSGDPLLSFISEIDSQLTPFLKKSPKARRHFKDALKNAQDLIKPSLPALASIAVKQLSGLTIKQLQEIIGQAGTLFSESMDTEDIQINDSSETTNESSEEIISKVASKAVEKALSQHASLKKSIYFFKKNISKLVKQLSEAKNVKLPIFIFVDEMDRCRPSYAIELLEHIKHLFGVSGIYFIVATDSRQMAHSIKAIYGNDFDSIRYLKRFFDQEYSFLPPKNRDFAFHLFKKNEL